MWFRRRVGREPFLLFFDVVCYVVRTSFGTSWFQKQETYRRGWLLWITDDRVTKRKESAKRRESADRSGKYFSTQETRTIERNCRRIFCEHLIFPSWKHSSYTYAIPWCFKIWAWLRHEFLETAIPWWSTSKFWPRHELGMSLSFDCTRWAASIYGV